MNKIKRIFNEKEIFELLNYIDLNENQYDDIDIKVSDMKKLKLKKNLKKNLKGKQKMKKYSYIIAIASLVLSCFIGGCFIDSTFAQNIPVLGSVIQKLNDSLGLSGEYSKYSQVVEKSITDKELTLTIKDVACDDNTLIIGYSVKSDKKIKDILPDKNMTSPNLINPRFKVNESMLNVSSAGRGEYVDGKLFIGTEELSVAEKNLPKIFNFDIEVHNIGGIEGNWNIKFSVSKEQIAKKTKTFNPNTKVEFKDCYINISKVAFSPIDTVIVFDGKYKKDRNKNVRNIIEYNEWFVLDDKEEQLIEKSSGGGSVFRIFKDFKYEMHFVPLKETPKYLTAIPYANRFYYNESGNYKIKEIEKFLNGTYPIELSQNKMGKVLIKDIKFLEDKTVVYYRAEGLAPRSQANTLKMIDENGNCIKIKDDICVLKNGDNPNDYIKEFETVDKNKKYKIAVRSFEDYDIREDLKFKIPLSK